MNRQARQVPRAMGCMGGGGAMLPSAAMQMAPSPPLDAWGKGTDE